MLLWALVGFEFGIVMDTVDARDRWILHVIGHKGGRGRALCVLLNSVRLWNGGGCEFGSSDAD